MIDPWLHAYIEQYRPVCPVCRVPLHPQWHECLRCRRRVQLGLKVLQAYLIAWGIIVCVLALESGMGVILCYVAWRDHRFGGWRINDSVYLGIGIAGLLSAAMIPAALALRRAFCGLPRVVQWLAMSFTTLILAASIALFLAFVH